MSILLTKRKHHSNYSSDFTASDILHDWAVGDEGWERWYTDNEGKMESWTCSETCDFTLHHLTFISRRIRGNLKHLSYSTRRVTEKLEYGHDLSPASWSRASPKNTKYAKAPNKHCVVKVRYRMSVHAKKNGRDLRPVVLLRAEM